MTGFLLWFSEVWLGSLGLTGSGGILKFFFLFGTCDLTFTFALTFCFGAVAMGAMI